MTGKERMENVTEVKLKAHGYDIDPILADKAILGRDHWMVHQSDVVYVNLIGATTVSIGCCMELAFAKAYNKHTIVVMESTNIHNHCFVLQCANIVFENTKEAEEYLKQLITGI
jgi:nucleoside 2-deoxyribosyltransferase